MVAERTKHTPGPWTADLDGYDYEICQGPLLIAELGSWPGSQGAEQIANARLIAAAPDLLEALKACEALIHACGPMFKGIQFEAGSPPALYEARAAIAKAEAA